MPFDYTFPFLFDPVGVAGVEGDLGVRIAFGSNAFADAPVWDDVSADVRSFRSHRGRQHELSRFETATLTIVLNNMDGHYWPNNTGGDHSPNVKIGKRIHVLKTWDADGYHVFTGYIERWKPGWISDKAGMGAIVTITAQCAMGLFARGRIDDAGYAEQLSGARVTEVLDSVGYMAADRSIDTGQELMQATGAMANVNPMTHLYLVQDSEISNFFISGGGKTVYEDRSHRTNSPHDAAVAVFGDDSGEMPYIDADFQLDDVLIKNEVRLTRIGGTEQESSNSTSSDEYGPRYFTKTGLLLLTDELVYLNCVFYIARYSDNSGMRIKAIEIQPKGSPSDLWAKVLGYDISTRITVRLNQASIDGDYFIEGIEQRWSAGTSDWRCRWELSEASQYFYAPDDVTLVLRPDGAGDVTEQDPQPAVANHLNVDEAVKDDDTSYNRAPPADPANDKNDLYHVADPSVAKGTIKSVVVSAWLKYSGANPIGGMQHVSMKTNGTTYYTAGLSPTGAYAEYTLSYGVNNPQTGSPWTWAEIVALQIGTTLWSDIPLWGTEYRNTQIYVTVIFTPAW